MGTSIQDGSKFVRPAQIRVVRSESLLPDPARSGVMFGRFGYTLSEAVADLIDNSLDAHATRITVRFVRSDERILRILIVDNGTGMNDKALEEGMRFGSHSVKTTKALGKYGFGLKTASLSQSGTIFVFSKTSGGAIGRKWTRDNIGKGWKSEVLESNDIGLFLAQGKLVPQKSGTVVVWEAPDHFQTTAATIENVIKRLQKVLAKDLGLWFHRFIGSSKLSIILDQQIGAAPPDMRVEVKALDPFSYPASARLPGYPKFFDVSLGKEGSLTLECHIWPPNSEDDGYRLGGGKVSARQGFYFYRNKRLIQAGGWNGCRDNDNEPHLSLARVRVDLPAALDDAFNLKVTKSGVVAPSQFAGAVEAASNRRGSFKDYIAAAQAAYRNQKKKDGSLFPYVPGAGFPSSARKAAKGILWEQGTGKPKKINFKWQGLDPYEFVRLDPDRNRILLNIDYRSRVLGTKRASSADAPIIKLLLFFLLQEEFDRRASSEQYRNWLKRVNETIVMTLTKEG